MRREFWLLVQVGFWFLVFGIFSVLVYFTRGKNRNLLLQKLRVGALIVSLTAVLTGGCTAVNPPPKCYVPVTDDPTVLIDPSGELPEELSVSDGKYLIGEFEPSLQVISYNYQIIPDNPLWKYPVL